MPEQGDFGEQGTGIWDLGFGIWDLGLGIWGLYSPQATKIAGGGQLLAKTGPMFVRTTSGTSPPNPYILTSNPFIHSGFFKVLASFQFRVSTFYSALFGHCATDLR